MMVDLFCRQPLFEDILPGLMGVLAVPVVLGTIYLYAYIEDGLLQRRLAMEKSQQRHGVVK